MTHSACAVCRAQGPAMGKGRGDQSKDYTDILRIQSVYLDVREKLGRGGTVTITTVNTKHKSTGF